MIENWERILTIVNSISILILIICGGIFLFKKSPKNNENSLQSDDVDEQQEKDINQEKQQITPQQNQKKEHVVLQIGELSQQKKNNDQDINQYNQTLQNIINEINYIKQYYGEQQINLQQIMDQWKKQKDENKSTSTEVNQIKYKLDQVSLFQDQKNQEMEKKINENLNTLQNDITKQLSDIKQKYDQEFQAINQKLIAIPNQDQLQKMIKQIETLESCYKRLDENCSTTKLNLQSQQQGMQVTLEEIYKTRNNFEKYYNQTNLPILLKNLQDFESKLIELTVNKIITFDQKRLENIQKFVYKLYEESSNKRAVDLQYRYFVRETLNFEEMARNYSLKLSPKVELKKHCTSYKPVRGDGNCFYTAFVYQFLEFVICSYNQTQFQEFIDHCFKINLPMRLKINKHEPESVDEQLQNELLTEFIYRLQEIRNIQKVEERRQVYEKQFAAFEKQNEEIDGCFYALASIFIRNYTNYAVEFHELKEALFDRANLLIWEEECESSTEVVMQSLQRKLNLNIKLVFIQKDNTILVNNYENNSKFNIILILKPGHYGIGYFNHLPLPEEENNNGNYQAFLEQINLATFKNQPELVTLNLIRFHIKMVDYLNQQSQNIIKVKSVSQEQQNIY